MLWSTDAAYTNLGTNTPNPDPTSIDIDGTLTLTSDIDVLDPATLTSPIYTGAITAGGIVVQSSTGVWPPVPAIATNSPKAQSLTGDLTVGAGGISVQKGAILKLDGNVTFTEASSIHLATRTYLMGSGTITAGGNIAFSQAGDNISWDGSKWGYWAYTLASNFNMQTYNLDIDFVYNKFGFSGTISGTGYVSIHNDTADAERTFEMMGKNNTYEGGTLITGRVNSNGLTPSGTASTTVRVYQSDEVSEVYATADGKGTSQYYKTKSLGTGTITLRDAVISNGDQQCVTLTNELYIPTGHWGVIRPGSANSGTSVKYFDIAGKITGGGAVYISQDSGTALIRNANNDYSGGTFIGNSPSNLGTDKFPATIEIGADNCLGTGPVTLNHPKAVLDLNGFQLAIGGLSSEKYSKPNEHSGTYLTDVYLFDGATDKDATLTVSGGSEYVYAGKFTDKDGNNALKNMVKTGDGTQTFVSALNAGLHLTVDGGTIKLSQKECVNSAGETVVSKGGILQVPRVRNGSITTDYTLTYTEGDTDYLEINGGDYTVEGLSSGTLRVDIGSRTEHSRFNLLQKPTYTEGIGFVDVNLLGYQPNADDYFILSYDTSDNGRAFASDTVTTPLEDWLLEADRANWDLTWYYNDVTYGTSLVLEYRGRAVIPEVPEPTSITLLFLGMGVLLLRRSLRRSPVLPL